MPGTLDGAEQPVSRSLVICGAGGHAVSVANVALSAGYTLAHFIDGYKAGQELFGCKVIAEPTDVGDPQAYSYAIALGDNSARERVYRELIASLGEVSFPALIHSSAVLCSLSSVGAGTVVMPGALIGPNSLVGRFCIVNTRASIDHDCVMEDYASLAPGAVTGGGVRVGERAAVAIGAVVKHGLEVGADSVLGANSYLHRDLPANVTAYGSPAREVRAREAGDKYL